MNPQTIFNRTEMLKQIQVSDLMTPNVITVDHDDLIGKASRLMLENRIHSLLVLKEGKPTYMITTFDLIKVSYEDTFSESNADMMRTTIEELVKGQKMVSVQTTTTLLGALKLLTEYDIHSLPVINEGRVMGILTLMDLANWYVKTHEV
ncbi:MAG: CBS domain-containing protein [Spirochaetota bacterium]